MDYIERTNKGILRLSKEEDKQEIDSLLHLCFGGPENPSWTDSLDGRYCLVTTHNGKVVSLSGLIKEHNYNCDYEIDWTCTHYNYRHMGFMNWIWNYILSPDKSYMCSAWRTNDDYYPHLKSLLDKHGFECVLKNRVSYCYKYYCYKKFGKCNCPYFVDDSCHCCEDLYYRRVISLEE